MLTFCGRRKYKTKRLLNDEEYKLKQLLEIGLTDDYESSVALTDTQVKRIGKEFIESGYVETLDKVTLNMVLEYAELKKYFPRSRFNKLNFDIAKKSVNRFKHDSVHAEDVYKLVMSLNKDIADSTFYYWFDRLGYKFKTTGRYPKPVVVMVVYLALSKKSK